MKRKTLTLLSKILVNVFAILFGVILVGGIIAQENRGAISSFLGTSDQEIVPSPEAAEKLEQDPFAFEYFPSAYDSVADVKKKGEELTEQIVAGGATLLKNENDALPLSGKKVSLFSISSVDLVYAGTGSSGTNTSASVTLKQGMERAGFQINEALWNWYSDNKGTYGRGSAGGTVGATFAIKDASWDKIPDSAGKADKTYGDAAIFVLSRNGGEGADLTVKGGNTSDMTNGNYLELSANEISVLKELKKLKGNVFDKIIVLMNSANQVQCDFVDNEEYGIDALLWCGDLGATGAYAVGDILAGNVNPSGRLSDTFWKEHYLNPVYANWGAYSYSGSIASGKSDKYVVYQEGIYNGYRYTETRYEDYVLGQGNAGDFKYEDIVSYPFGYGLSYTEFEYSNFDVKRPSMSTKDVYNVTVDVQNKTDVPGKEVVQIYLQKPYTDYDKANGVEKAAVELVGFDKVELGPNEKKTVTIEVEGKYFARNDAEGARTYIVDKGDYFFAVGKDAHDALNNILAAKGKGVGDGMTAAGNDKLTKKINVANFDAETYSVSTKAKENGIKDSETKITNQFDDTDLNRYAGKGNNSVTYVSRNDWSGTVKLGLDTAHKDLGAQVKISGTDQMRADIKTPKIEKDDREYPTYGKGYVDDETPAEMQLIDLRAYSEEVDDGDVTNDEPIPYNDPLWDQFLDQITWEETIGLLADGFRRTVGVNRVGKFTTIDHNGATGPVQPYGDNSNSDLAKSVNQGLAVRTNDKDKNQKPTLYPSNGLCASTYDIELIREYGRVWGEDCLWSGYNGLYGPGLNTHRGAYCGRNFEYYSEDGVLTGIIAAALTEGMAEKGAYVYLKHCFLNDQEYQREGICTWANEQSIREIYLRGFQIAIEDGGADCVMTGFNRLGVKWTGHQGFCNTVLHDEFGMTGFAVSDWWQSYMDVPMAVYYGNDLPDGSRSASDFNAYREGYGEMAWRMRESVHRIMYTVVQSNAMNGKASGMRIVKLTPWWVSVVSGVQIATGVLFGASVLFLGAMMYVNKFKPGLSAD